MAKRARGAIPKHWKDRAALFLKLEAKRLGVTYEMLAERLVAQGIKETRASLGNKLCRGTFAASFFLAALAALGTEGLKMNDLEKLVVSVGPEVPPDGVH